MKKDTLEEIVADFKKSYEGILPPESIERGAEWYRNALTSYRNDVLEEAHDEIKKLNAYGDGQIAFKHQILEVIKTLKVDI